MRIRCPSCSATYEVPDALLDPPRTVRCAKCAHDWMAAAIPPDPQPAAAAAPEEPAEPFAKAPPPETPVAPVAAPAIPEPAARAPVYQPEEPVGDTPLSAIERLSVPADLSSGIVRRDRVLTAAWAASFAILAGLGVAAYTERNLLMRQWPASKRVYATLGIAPLDAKADDTKVGEAKGGDTKAGDTKEQANDRRQ